MHVQAQLHRASGSLTSLSNGRHAWSADIDPAELVGFLASLMIVDVVADEYSFDPETIVMKGPGALKVSLDQTRDAWRAALSSGTSKSDLEAACKTMYDSAKTAMSAYGCSDF